jgi:hypothetical protein
MTSVERELLERAEGVCLTPPPSLSEDVRDAVVNAASKVFSLEPRAVSAAEFTERVSS